MRRSGSPTCLQASTCRPAGLRASRSPPRTSRRPDEGGGGHGMKVAVFGGSGFLGTAFLRTALRRGGIDSVFYTSSGARPAALGGAALDVRPYAPDHIGDLTLHPDTDAIVNFAHPFERRGALSGADQIRQF